MALSEHTHRLIEGHCRRYCAPVCPPSVVNQVRLGFRMSGDDVWIHELRPLFRTLGMYAVREVALACLRFAPVSRDWSLHHCVDGHLRPYAPLPRARNFLRLLREFDRDPHGVFWPHLNGASLRWCSAGGRCRQCELRYARVLGPDGGEADLQRCGP